MLWRGGTVHILGNNRKELKFRLEIRRRLNSGYACYLSVRIILSSSFLSKNMKIKTHRTIVLYVLGTWSLTLWEERRLWVYENWVLRRIFAPKGGKQQGSGEDYITRSLILCTPHQILFRWSNWEEYDGLGKKHVWGRGVYLVLVGTPERKKPLRRPCRRWEYNR